MTLIERKHMIEQIALATPSEIECDKAAPVLLMGQDTSTSTQKAQHVCMRNEAVCQHGNMVSIGVVATDSDMSKLDGLHDVKELGFLIGPIDRPFVRQNCAVWAVRKLTTLVSRTFGICVIWRFWTRRVFLS